MKRPSKRTVIIVIVVIAMAGFFFAPIVPTSVYVDCPHCGLQVFSHILGLTSPSYAILGFGLVIIPDAGCAQFYLHRPMLTVVVTGIGILCP